MKKRGISPLIATVLIIGFVIVISIIVISFIQSNIGETIKSQERTAKLANANVVVKAYEYSYNCSLSNDLEILIGNLGEEEVIGFVTTVSFSSGEKQVLSLDGLSFFQFDQRWFIFPNLDCSRGDILEIEVAPKILLDEEEIVAIKGSSNTKTTDSGDGSAPEPTCTDNDGDSYGIDDGICIAPFDCNDTNPNVNPGKIEICGNLLDEDCDGIAQLCIDGTSCNSDSQCLGGYCVHNKCRSESTYCGDGYCDAGESCTSDNGGCSPPSHCRRSVCTNGCVLIIDDDVGCNTCHSGNCVCINGDCKDDLTPA